MVMVVSERPHRLGRKGRLGRQPLYAVVPEERLDVVHLASWKAECLGCGHENAVGRRFCEVCGRILTA